MKLKQGIFIQLISISIIILSFFWLGSIIYQDYTACKLQGEIMFNGGIVSCEVYGFSKDYTGNCLIDDPDPTDYAVPNCELIDRRGKRFLISPLILIIIGIVGLSFIYHRKFFLKRNEVKSNKL